jgi:hypothetical protein
MGRRTSFTVAVLAGVLVGLCPAGASARATAKEFFARNTKAHISCFVADGFAGEHEAGCEQLSSRRIVLARLRADGTVVTCESRHPTTSTCEVGNPGERTPTFGYGHRVAVGRFRCVVLRTGVRCVIGATGKGFLFGPRGTVAVGGAILRPAPRHLESFLSPDRKVWCSLGTGNGASCGTEPAPPTHSAGVDANGKVSLCNVLKLEYPGGSHAPNGCYQNWDPNLPVLAIGQEAEFDGFLCVSAANGITCTVEFGSGSGKGFRVSATEAVEVG